MTTVTWVSQRRLPSSGQPSLTLNAVSANLCLPGYSVAAGEFSGDDEEGEGHIYSAGNQCGWLALQFGDPLHTPINYSSVSLSLHARCDRHG